MKILVCVKQVPDTETRVRIAPDGAAIVEADINWVVSPYDEFAIEEALRLREAKGGEVVLLSLGPDRVQTALRTGLAMGADSAVHVKAETSDTLATARALAAAIARSARSTCPHRAARRRRGQQPDARPARRTPRPAAGHDRGEARDKRGQGEGRARGRGRRGGVGNQPARGVSAQKGLNEPRYASLKGIMAAKKKTIESWDAAALGLAEADLQPHTRVTALALPPAARRREDDRRRRRRAGEGAAAPAA